VSGRERVRDKTSRWSLWYREAIPAADALNVEHLATLKEEGSI
jgi:hypothetical protein